MSNPRGFLNLGVYPGLFSARRFELSLQKLPLTGILIERIISYINVYK